MRVATIIHGYYPRVGGAETQLKALVPYLQKQGIEMQILTRRYNLKLPAVECVDDANVYRLPAPGPKAVASLVFTLAALWKIFRLRPQLVHAHEFISPSTVALLANRLLGMPIVVTLHRSGPIGDVQKMERKTFGTMRLEALKRQVDKFVVISDEIWNELIGIGISKDRLIRITNGVDVEHFSPLSPDQKSTLRTRSGFAPESFIAIFTGRLVPEKRIDLLLSIWPTIIKAYPKAELVIAGEGPEELRLRSMAVENVHFMGSTTDVVPFLQMADVFILPSVAEGLSVALLEAMSCGLVPLLTNVGGARDVVVHRENGWLVSPDDKAALVDGFKFILENPQFLIRAGQAARQRVVEGFSAQFAAEKLRDLYFDLAGAK